ncbi:restriction endonuclease subunit S [Streptomyces fungicidicus]|uniref:restriction endonuclease subunit S n=1 Tax=Streptomyces fungicidicus TaxID=68203 RepID=UPI003D721624
MISPFSVPENWQWVSFGSVASVVSNLVDPSEFPDSVHVAPNNIEAGTGNLLPCAKVSEDGVESPKHSFSAGQILYSKIRPYLAKVAIPEFSGLCSADIYPIETSIDSRYLWRWMLSADFTSAVSRHEGRGVLPKINKSALATLPVPLPPRAEQKRIAAVLDQVDALRAKRREALALLDELAQSIFLDMFGGESSRWPVVDIEKMCSVVVDCVNKTAPTVDHVTPYKMIRTTNVRHERVDVSNVRYVTKETFLKWNRRVTPQRGDVLLTREAPVGEAGIIESDDSVFLGQRLMLYRPNPNFSTSEYLSAALMSPYLSRQYEQSSSGSTVKHLSLPTCRGLKLPAPPIAEQEVFAARIKALRAQELTHRAHLDTLDELFTSLHHRAFSGTLWDHEATGEAA